MKCEAFFDPPFLKLRTKLSPDWFAGAGEIPAQAGRSNDSNNGEVNKADRRTECCTKYQPGNVYSKPYGSQRSDCKIASR